MSNEAKARYGYGPNQEYVVPFLEELRQGLEPTPTNADALCAMQGLFLTSTTHQSCAIKHALRVAFEYDLSLAIERARCATTIIVAAKHPDLIVPLSVLAPYAAIGFVVAHLIDPTDFAHLVASGFADSKTYARYCQDHPM